MSFEAIVDDGHTMITLAHHEHLAHGELKGSGELKIVGKLSFMISSKRSSSILKEWAKH